MIENFRDVSKFNDSIVKGLVYRSSVCGIAQNITFLEELNIKTILDLRMPFEIEDSDYRILLPASITYYNIPINLEYAKTMYQGTPMESVYKFFALNCKIEIAAILKVLLKSDGNFLIHCRQGMDRTGFVIALIHLICNTSKDKITQDYLETGELAKKTHIDIFLNSISTHKNIKDYIVSDNFRLEELNVLQNKLLKDTNMEINVCFATNDSYAPHAAALVVSIMTNKLPEDEMFFHFFSDNTAPAIQNSFRQMSQTMGFKLAIYEMSDKQFAHLPLFMGSRTTYFRLSMQKLLPESINFFLYLDCDMIVMSNLQELYSTDISEHYAAVVAEASQVPHLPVDYPYFNGGMVLFNLEKYRIENLEKEAIRFGYEHRDWIRFADQEILNYIFRGNVIYLPPKWNAIGKVHIETIICEFGYKRYPYSDREILEADNEPRIIHYVTNNKPWLPICEHPHKASYWKYLQKTPFYEQVQDEYCKQK